MPELLMVLGGGLLVVVVAVLSWTNGYATGFKQGRCDVDVDL